MFELSGEFAGRHIDDMGDWSSLVDNILDQLSGRTYREDQTIKQILTNPRSIYIAGSDFWVELKEMV